MTRPGLREARRWILVRWLSRAGLCPWLCLGLGRAAWPSVPDKNVPGGAGRLARLDKQGGPAPPGAPTPPLARSGRGPRDPTERRGVPSGGWLRGPRRPRRPGPRGAMRGCVLCAGPASLCSRRVNRRPEGKEKECGSRMEDGSLARAVKPVRPIPRRATRPPGLLPARRPARAAQESPPRPTAARGISGLQKLAQTAKTRNYPTPQQRLG